MTITQDRNYLRQLEDKELLKRAQEGTSELALVLAERLKEKTEERDPYFHCDGCACDD